MYQEKIEFLKNHIPNIFFSIKEYNGNATNNNYIYVNNNYASPISIILSLDRSSDNYPVFVDRTTISTDFYVNYPTLYIKFFIKYDKDNVTSEYEPATLVISSDGKFYII